MAAASAAAFSVQGSVEQVDVTELAANAQVSLPNSSGATVYTQNADSLGGLLFRDVTPGAGYRVGGTGHLRASVAHSHDPPGVDGDRDRRA